MHNILYFEMGVGKGEKRRDGVRTGLQLHQPLHSVRHCEARLGHNLSRLLRHLRHGLNLAQLICVLAQFPQDLIALFGRGGREVVVADSDDTGYDSDDLSEVFVQRWGRCWRANAREDALDSVDDRLGLSLEVRLGIYIMEVSTKKFKLRSPKT